MKDKIFTIGLVVMKRAYLLNCVCPSTPGINNCKLPARCPKRNVTRNKPESDASPFRNMVEVNIAFHNFLD